MPRADVVFLASLFEEEATPMITAYFDSSFYPKNQVAGIGVWMIDSKKNKVADLSITLPATSVNEAEYLAAINAMKLATNLKFRRVTFIGDVQLIIRQLTREYQVHKENLKELWQRAVNLKDEFSHMTF
ncbi:uncharacterized protein LOC112347703 [Selaginella moellendorffii]|uniref:uncharacterized protein LOC112347703 n=1 Tax=Selaginella moellendorffii TaxID=88036 RepID=UPI000D1D12CE|nr:uncharacterized protein LOC112347703 [Selaginella moellendorffii]|eukprot:XP_024534801.1 uncharacterized protein LOC112347703 [Selaginella moellendorffii]